MELKARAAPPAHASPSSRGNAQGFIRYVRRPSGQMPAYSEKILSDQELTDIFAYVRSLPAAKAVKDVPLLDQLRPK